MNRRSTKKLSFAMIAILTLTTTALSDEKDRTAEEIVIRPVRSIVVEPRAGGELITVTGTVEPRAETNLGFRIGGKVIDRYVDIGDKVAPQQVLARLDDKDERNALHAAQAELSKAKADQLRATNGEERQRILLSKGVTSQSDYDLVLRAKKTAEAQVDSAKANVRLATDRVNYTVLTADRAGVVTAIGANAGQVVQAGDMIIRVTRPEDREAIFNVSEAILQSAPEDPSIEVSLANAPNVIAVGRVREFSPLADPVTRTHTIRVALENPPAAMRLGTSVTGRIRVPSDTVVQLPQTALLEVSGKTFVWLVDASTKTVRREEVVVEKSPKNGWILVSRGLRKGDTVVTAGVHSLKDGQRVLLNP